MKKLILLLVLIPFFVIGQYTNTYYYDFSRPTNGTGTQASPFNAFSNTRLISNTEHLFKRGVTAEIGGTQMSFNGNNHATNIRVAAYGSGTARPILTNSHSDGLFKIMRDHNIIIDSINGVGQAGAMFIQAWNETDYYNENIYITNCEIENYWVGIWWQDHNTNPSYFDYQAWNVYIDNNDIHDCTSDGIIMWGVRNLWITNNRIYNINKKCLVNETCWGDLGDCIQVIHDMGHRGNGGGCYILNNYLDKSNTPCKFSLILDENNIEPRFILVAGNTLIPPATGTDRNGSQRGSMFLIDPDAESVDTVVVIGNLFSGRKTEYSKDGYVPTNPGQWGPDYLYMYNNIFDSIPKGGSMPVKYAYIEHNTIITGDDGLTSAFINGGYYGDGGYIRNNTFATRAGSFFTNNGSIVKTNNTTIIVSDMSTWNSLANVVDWENSDFRAADDLNNGVPITSIYWNGLDYDSVIRANPPEIGAFEYVTPEACDEPPTAPLLYSGTACTQTAFTIPWSHPICTDRFYITVDDNSNFSSPVSGWDNTNLGDVTSVTVNTGLSANTLYYVRVRGWNVYGYSPYSNTITVTTCENAPAAPTNILTLNVGETTASFSWTASATADDYQVMLDNNSDFSSPIYNNVSTEGLNYFLFTSLVSNTTYWFKVKAYNICSCSGENWYSSYSTAISFSTLELNDCPSTVVALSAADNTTDGFDARWQLSPLAENYLFYMATDRDFINHVIGYNGLDVGNVTSYIITGLPDSTIYFYRVKGINPGCLEGEVSYSNTIETYTEQNIPEAPVVYLDLGSETVSELGFYWETVDGADGYYYQIYYTSGYNQFLAESGYTESTSITIENLDCETEHRFWVMSSNEAGQSGWSNVVLGTTNICIPTSAPTGTFATYITPTSFTANWYYPTIGYPPMLQDCYIIVTEGTPDLANALPAYDSLLVGEVTSYPISGLTDHTIYFYYVGFVNESGYGPLSSPIRVYTEEITTYRIITANGVIVIKKEGDALIPLRK